MKRVDHGVRRQDMQTDAYGSNIADVDQEANAEGQVVSVTIQDEEGIGVRVGEPARIWCTGEKVGRVSWPAFSRCHAVPVRCHAKRGVCGASPEVRNT